MRKLTSFFILLASFSGYSLAGGAYCTMSYEWYSCASSEEAACQKFASDKVKQGFTTAKYEKLFDSGNGLYCVAGIVPEPSIHYFDCDNGGTPLGGGDINCSKPPEPEPEPEKCKANLPVPLSDMSPPVSAIDCGNGFYNYSGCLAEENTSWDSGSGGVGIGVMCLDGDNFCTGYFRLTGAATSCSRTDPIPPVDPEIPQTPEEPPEPEVPPSPENPETPETPETPENPSGGGGSTENGGNDNGSSSGGGSQGGGSQGGSSIGGGSENGSNNGSNNGSENGSENGTEGGEGFCDPSKQECGDDDSKASGLSCDEPLACDGDAIQCAQLEKQKEIKCAQEELYNYDKYEKDINAVLDGQPSEFEEEEVDLRSEVGFGSANSRWLPAGSCPPPLTITATLSGGGVPIKIDFAGLCAMAEAVAGVIVGLASLLGLKIVAGARA